MGLEGKSFSVGCPERTMGHSCVPKVEIKSVNFEKKYKVEITDRVNAPPVSGHILLNQLFQEIES